MIYVPEEPLWEKPEALLRLDKIREAWCPIDGIMPQADSPRHHQLIVAAKGRRLYRERNTAWLLERIRRHLGVDAGTWRYQRPFLADFSRAFLSQHPDRTVYMQVLPQRKTFRTLYVDGRPGNPQTVCAPDFQFHAACLDSESIRLRFGIRLSGDNMLVGGPPDERGTIDDLWWTKLDLERRLGRSPITETWFCLARVGDEARLRNGSVPALDHFFDPTHKIQSAPIVSFCAISQSGRVAYTHCYSLHPRSGTLLDIRQSERPLKYQLHSAPPNHSGLRTLVYGRQGT